MAGQPLDDIYMQAWRHGYTDALRDTAASLREAGVDVVADAVYRVLAAVEARGAAFRGRTTGG